MFTLRLLLMTFWSFIWFLSLCISIERNSLTSGLLTAVIALTIAALWYGGVPISKAAEKSSHNSL